MATRQEFTRAEVLRMAGVSASQFRRWETNGLLEPTEVYDFRHLLAIRTLIKLKAERLRPDKIRRALDSVREKLDGVENPLTDLKLYVDGKRIHVRIGGQHVDAESGQLVLAFHDEPGYDTAIALERRDEKERAAASRRKQQEAESWFLRGVDFEQNEGPKDKAIEAYRVAIALEPQFAAALVNLGTIYFNQHDLARAQKYYGRAIDANPRYALAHFNLGNLHDERGETDEARRHYLTALDIDQNYADAHYNLALLYQNTREVMKAVRHWRSYLAIDPGSIWADAARRELNRLLASTIVHGRQAR
ncbi:MAG: tetratricopeptide repeat protein [Bryobacteraceae bacterium]